MERNPSSKDAASSLQKSRGWIKNAIHLAIVGITLVFVGIHVKDALGDPELQEYPLSIDGRWLLVSITTYVVGLAILGVPWWLALRDTGAQDGLFRILRVYLISHVGKYVPGKALVIVIRCGLLKKYGLSIGQVTTTSFYETFATMASGSTLALVCLTFLTLPGQFLQVVESKKIWWIMLGSTVAFGAAVLPPLFRLFSKTITMPFEKARVHGEHTFSLRTCAAMIGLGLLSWSVVGISYLATINTVTASHLGRDAWSMTTTCVTVSIVGGFVSMVPGQIGVRDLILIEALIPVVGKPVAVAASIMFRLTTLFSELGVGAILYLGGRRR